MYLALFVAFFLFSIDLAEARTTEESFSEKPGIDFFGDIRSLLTRQTDKRGDLSNTDYINQTRIRLGGSYVFNDRLSFRMVAGIRLSTNQESVVFRLQNKSDGSGTYPAGTIALTETSVRYVISPNLTLTAGRFNSAFALAGFIPRGLDRFYGNNINLSFTDGFWLRWHAGDWILHGIGSYNTSGGSLHAARPPISFSSRRSRISGFVAVQHSETEGLWVQREASLSITPAAVLRNGALHPLITGTARATVRLPLELSRGDYWIGAELGFIPVVPSPEDAGLQVDESLTIIDSSAFAWMAAAHANDVYPGHSVGLHVAWLEPQWYMSSNVSPNTTQIELRYVYRPLDMLSIDLRYRIRQENIRPEDQLDRRRTSDLRLRATYSF